MAVCRQRLEMSAERQGLTTARSVGLEEPGRPPLISPYYSLGKCCLTPSKACPLALYLPSGLCLAPPVDQCLQATRLLDTEPILATRPPFHRLATVITPERALALESREGQFFSYLVFSCLEAP